jgi:hypothetical protein
MQTSTKCSYVLGGIPRVFFWFLKSLARGQVNVVGQSLIVHVVTLSGGGINAWQIHQFWSPPRPKYSFLGPIPGVYILYIYIGRDIWGPTTAKAETRQKGKPTNPTSNLWISFSLVCFSTNPFES